MCSTKKSLLLTLLFLSKYFSLESPAVLHVISILKYYWPPLSGGVSKMLDTEGRKLGVCIGGWRKETSSHSFFVFLQFSFSHYTCPLRYSSWGYFFSYFFFFIFIFLYHTTTASSCSWTGLSYLHTKKKTGPLLPQCALRAPEPLLSKKRTHLCCLLFEKLVCFRFVCS